MKPHFTVAQLTSVHRTARRVLLGILLACASFGAVADSYRVDTTHSFVQFRTQHLGFSWLIGRFNRFDGKFSYDANGPSAIEMEVQTASVDSNHAERDKHLRSADFLNSKKYPRASFVSSGYDGDAESGELRGELTLHGVTRPITIAMRKIGEGKDPWGGYRVGFAGEAVITRADFNINSDLGPTAQQVELSLFIEGVRN